MAVGLRQTEAVLGLLSSGEFERLVNEYVRSLHPNLLSTGATIRDESYAFPVDALGYEPGDPPTWVFVASTTTQEDDLAEKWVGQGQKDNDIKKAAHFLEELRAHIPGATGKLYLALNYRLGKRAGLWSDAEEEGKRYGLEIETVDVTALASYLDTTGRGHYLRETYLGIPAILLTRDLLHEIAEQSISLLRNTVAVPLQDPSYEVHREMTDSVTATLMETGRQFIAVQGGAGLGKTTLLAQVGDALNASEAVALWIPAHLFEPGVSLEALLFRALQRIRPGVDFTAGTETLRIASMLSGGLVLLVDDVNRERDPYGRISAITSTLNPAFVSSYAQSSTQQSIRCVVPLWPGNRPRDGGPQDLASKGWVITDLDAYTEREQVSLADAHGITAAERRAQFAVVGGDPFVCGLLMRLDSAAAGENPRHVLRSVFDHLILEASDEAARLVPGTTSGQIRAALDSLVDLMIATGESDPEWVDICSNVSQRESELLYAVTKAHRLGSIDVHEERETWRWKHVRVRDVVVGRRLGLQLAQGLAADVLPSDLSSSLQMPELAEASAIALIFLEDRVFTEHINGILPTLRPLSRAEILRLRILAPESDAHASLVSSLREVAAPEASTHQHYVTDERWHVVAKLNEAHDPGVLGILCDAPEGPWELAARIRNGDVDAALAWITDRLRHDRFPPHAGNDLLEPAFRELASHSEATERVSELVSDPGDGDEASALILLAGYLAAPSLADTIWRAFEHLDAQQKQPLLQLTVWALSRCVDERSAESLRPALYQWATGVRDPHGVPEAIEELWMSLNHWDFSTDAKRIWADVAIDPIHSDVALTFVLRRLDEPNAVEAFVRWAVEHPTWTWALNSSGEDPLAPHDSALNPYPRSQSARERLWQLVVGTEPSEVRRYAFAFWEHYATREDLPRLRSLDPSDELHDTALRSRLRLRDILAAPLLVEKLRADPAVWTAYVPAVSGATGTLDALTDVLDAALSDWFQRNDVIFLHLASKDVARIVVAQRDVLLNNPTTWNALWRSDDPSAQALVREAIARVGSKSASPDIEQGTESDLRFFFFAGSGGRFPYPVTYSMLEAIHPVLQWIPEKELEHLAQLAVDSGFDAWVWNHLQSHIPAWLRHDVWPTSEEVIAALDEAASAVLLGSSAPDEVSSFFHVLTSPQSQVELSDLVRHWLGAAPKSERLIVAGIVLDHLGTGRDRTWWKGVEPEDPALHEIWSGVCFTLSRRRWHA